MNHKTVTSEHGLNEDEHLKKGAKMYIRAMEADHLMTTFTSSVPSV